MSGKRRSRYWVSPPHLHASVLFWRTGVPWALWDVLYIGVFLLTSSGLNTGLVEDGGELAMI
jgi:hypothetical protein